MKYFPKETLPLLDALAKLSPESSRTTLRSWLKEGRVTVDGQVVKIGNTPVHKEQEIALGQKKKIIPGNVHILYEDPHIIVIEKPEGLLSVATAFEKGETAHAILKAAFRPRRVHVVHRLDQDTSGVMIFALTEEARDELKKTFEKHAIERAYSAIVEGILKPAKGTWQSYLYEDGAYVVHPTNDPDKGELAITHFEVVNTSKRHSWIDVRLETGKKNQIRVHCQIAGHPVVGDKKYGAKANPVKRLCLHARLLAFSHPITKKEMRFESPVPEIFYQILKP